MSERYIPEHRRNFKAKQSFKPDELRRRREEQLVEIRKAKREESLAKRRNLAATSPAPGAVDSDDEGATESQVCFAVNTRLFCLYSPRQLKLPRYKDAVITSTTSSNFKCLVSTAFLILQTRAAR